jgi:hypothetical protein
MKGETPFFLNLGLTVELLIRAGHISRMLEPSESILTLREEASEYLHAKIYLESHP